MEWAFSQQDEQISIKIKDGGGHKYGFKPIPGLIYNKIHKMSKRKQNIILEIV